MPSLTDKYRPTEFSEVKGNRNLVSIIRRTLKKKMIPQTWILQGPKGCGKTTIARIMANELGAKGRDLYELNLSSMRGIDTARALIENLNYMPVESKSKVIILNECHKATNEFQNAMLEDTEEPPENVYFILCTTEPNKLLPTLVSRCTLKNYSVKTLRRGTLTNLVEEVLESEDKKWSESQIKKLVRVSEGTPREALKLLDILIDLKSGRLNKALSEIEHRTKELPIELARAITKGQSWKAVKAILVDLEGEDVDGIRRLVLAYLSKVLMNNPSDRIGYAMECFEDSFIDSGMPGLILAAFKSITYK